MQQRPRKKVCIQCRRAHTACDGQQPCRRCIGAGIADQCCPPPPGKPRGRYMTGGLAGGGGATVGAAGAPLQMPVAGMPALAPHVMPAQTTFASAFASSADPSAGAGAGLADPYAQPQAKKQRSDPDGGATAGMMGMPHMLYGGAQGGTTTSTSTAAELSQIKSLMSMLIEQVREVKRENADLREEVLDMRMRLDDNDAIHKRHMDELRREVTAAGLMGPRKGRRSHDSSSSSSALSLSTTTLANSGNTTANVLESALQRQAIMTTLPFVREYSEHLDSFVLNDVMTDAFAVFYMGEPKSVEELSVNPPVFVHASPACCALTGFTQEELMGKPIFMLCQTEKEMIFVILTRIFSKPTKPTGEIFVTTMTWATKDKRALVVRLRHQIFYNKQRQPKWYFVAVESVLDDDAPEPQRSLSDILHNPSELQRFKSQFSAFFDSLYTTKTVTTTVTTLHHAGPGAHALMGSSIPAAFPPSSTTTFSAFPAMSHHFPHAPVGAAQYYQQPLPQLGPASSEDYSPTSGSMSGSSSFDSSSPESNPLDPATTSSSSSSTLSSTSTLSSSAQAWSNITLAELLEDDECRAILQEQKRKAAESHQLQLQQQQQQQQINQRVNLASGSGGGSGKSLADQSLVLAHDQDPWSIPAKIPVLGKSDFPGQAASREEPAFRT